MFHVKRGRKTRTAVSTDVTKALPAPPPVLDELDTITEPNPLAMAPIAPAIQGAEMGVIQLKDSAPRRDTTKGALLGQGSKFEGKLTFEGTVQIDGEFYGDISSEGDLIIGESAKIEGTIQVASASVSGEVVGSITTTGNLELRPSARVTGELNVAALIVERGAYFDGQVKMTGRSL